ncbi:hypothetical protein SAMN02745163_01321 [Clostridium cavendishii DSM 21758]|uniref:Radical SAM superfamily enzyme YgiQ, UPF0313 family n=1 Tax=Clostridium cavendishii DSM 21758 TaxID=1121302 RepID=A0A1M6GLG8_9CLOT|nr:hypothetical protein [Clostridium cavendishii]SHJ10799.1 hypothetical protein SAMN02745163_01321 [Clostridium cavendishii DSM 21758]
MRIGLIDADLMDNGTRHPNLALMKLAGYYKSNGHEVTLIYNNYKEVKKYDKVFISKVFSFTNVPKWVIELEHVKIGGTGFFPDGGEDLSPEIEHHMPYYDLYKEYVEEQLYLGKRRSRFADYLDYSIGFTTRGCFRKCSFCVNKKYDRVFRHSPVSEFLDDKRPFVYLWDDNILAFENWEEVLNDIEATGKQFQFRQGIDIRLMTDKKAKRFNNAKYHGDFIFAFDHIQDRELIIEKVQLWRRYSTKICKMYVISGYESQDAEDIRVVFERIKILMKYGSLPYIMRYEDYKKSKYRGMYVQLARWCNQPNFFKKKSFREFCVANQEYHSNKETNCAAYQAMLDFEKDYPEIAAEYFDLKFEEENMYKFQYGFGRRYANKHLCNTCIKKNITWESIKDSEVDEKEVLKLYFTKQIDLQCCNYENSICNNIDLYSKYIVDLLLRTNIEDIIDSISKSDDLEDVLTREGLKLQDHNEALFTLIEFLNKDSGRMYTLKEISIGIGKDYDDKSLKDIEENLKFAALLDLVQITGTRSKAKVILSNLGKVYSSCSNDEKEKLILRLLFRIPKVQQEFIKENVKNVNKYVNIPKILGYRGSNSENMVILIQKNI